MLKSITLINYRNEVLELELQAPEKSGYLVTAIDGAAGAKAAVNITEIATKDGGTYSSSRLESISINITLAIIGATNVVARRMFLYSALPFKKPTTIKFAYTDVEEVLQIEGYIEQIDPTTFNQMQTITIAIRCPKSYFTATEKMITQFYGTKAAFTFPFSNKSLSTKTLKFGFLQSKDIQTIDYKGNRDVGMEMQIVAEGNVDNLTIYSTDTGEFFKLDHELLKEMTGNGIIAGDIISVDTSVGNKSIILLRDGQYTNIINVLAENSTWFQITQGKNNFAYYADSGIGNIKFTIANEIAYGGA